MKQLLLILILAFSTALAIAKTSTYLTYDAAAEKITQLLLKYQVTDDFIRLGDVYLKNANFGLKLEVDRTLTVFWPSEVFRGGKLELIKANGDIIFSRNIQESDLDTYTINTFDETRNNYHNSKISFPFEESWLNAIKTSGGVFFCLKNKRKMEFLEICSSPYKVNKTELVPSTKNSSTKVLFNGTTDQPLVGEIMLSREKDPQIQWFAQLQSGLSWSFKELVPQWQIAELVQIDFQLFRISGVGSRPLKYFTDHFTYKNRDFFYEVKPSPLISEHPDYWSFNLQATTAIDLNFMNPNGGIYTARLNINSAPNVLQTPIIVENNNPQLTYSSNIDYIVTVPPGASIEKQDKVKKAKEANNYTWKINKLKKGAIVRNEIKVKIAENSVKPFFLEIYRGHSADMGFQYTVSTLSGGIASGGEFHTSYWAEDFFGLAKADWLRLRLGMQIKYFKPQKKIPIAVNTSGSEKKEVEVSSSVIDFKYRFKPGLWGRDETFGLMLAQHQFVFDEYKLNLLGAGLFWARSMPIFFDDLFNFFPFFRYPKWVSTEFINFVQNSGSDLTLKNTYHLNFYGKVMWTRSIYGDLGFGMRSYSFNDAEKKRNPTLNLFFITFGLGFIF
jgi:hypothetical protein